MLHQAVLLWLPLFVSSMVQGYVITGANSGVNGAQRPARQEIRTLADSGPAFDLYILALQQLAGDPQSNLTSYYQLSSTYDCSSKTNSLS